MDQSAHPPLREGVPQSLWDSCPKLAAKFARLRSAQHFAAADIGGKTVDTIVEP